MKYVPVYREYQHQSIELKQISVNNFRGFISVQLMYIHIKTVINIDWYKTHLMHQILKLPANQQCSVGFQRFVSL